MEPSVTVDKITMQPSSRKTKPALMRRSLAEESARSGSRVKTERARSVSADSVKTRPLTANQPRLSVGGSSIYRSQMADIMVNKPLVGTVKAEKIKASSKAIREREQENGSRVPMKVTVTKKTGSEPMQRKVQREKPVKQTFVENAALTDLDLNLDSCASGSEYKSDNAAYMVAGLQSKRQGLSNSNRNGAVGQCDPDVAIWINGLKFKNPEKYVKLFGEQEIDMESLRLISEKHLRAIGITAVGPLNKLMQGIRDLRGDTFERYLEQFDLSRVQPSKVQGHRQNQKKDMVDSKIMNGRAGQEKGNAQRGDLRIVSTRSQSGSEENDVSVKGGGLDMIPVKEPKKARVGMKTKQFQPKETISSEQKKKEKLLEVRKTARERLGTHKKIEQEKLLKKKTGVPIQNRDFEGDTAVGLYGQNVSSAEPTPRFGDESKAECSTANTFNASTPAESTSRNPWASSVGLQAEEDVLVKSTEAQMRELQLQGRANEVVTRDLIEKLQDQLRSIRVQVGDKPGRDAGELVKRDFKVVEKSRTPEDPLTSETPLPSLSTRTSPPRPKSSPLKSMTKHELISEVRKQKQEYNQQIKNLESELGRLMKRGDPVKSCELPIADVVFREEDLIGEGAFSKVYLGSFQGVEVAIKRLTVPLDRHDKNYFAAEVSLLRELRHPHVVLLVGVCTTATLPLMVLEYMSGGSLFAAIHDSAAPPFDHVAYHNIAKDIALGMNYLHRHRPAILHLDLKSTNVLLSVHQRAKIADFGFSKLRHEADMAASRQGRGQTMLRGTPAWMAPEMLSGGEVTIKADVYSFGVILWEMYTREHPYHGCSTFQVLECLRTNKRPVIPSNCPATLSALISSCWNHNPAKRLQFKDILVKLEDLAFPPEWRTLFDAANVPQLALEDIDSAREIVGFVSKTLERDLESWHSSQDGNEVDFPVPQLDLTLIDLEDEEEDETTESDRVSSEQSRVSQRDRVSLDSWESEGVTPRSEQDEKSVDSWESVPEPLEPSQVSKGVNIPLPPPLPSSSLPATLPKRPVESKSPKVTLKGPLKDEVLPKVQAEDLIAQRCLLRSTTNQHPSQLKDLKDIPAETLTSIAMILKQAVEKRRLALKEGNGTDRSTEGLEGGAWSTAESSRPDTFRMDEI
ncbi:uncharacterized protein LOC135493962 [Lineus longissimus]|uniref:uncharacterized protein LOC135493962 n=1 Tax=Lineus longissimus TaxID=88925 RepID=UPI00315D1FFB